MRPTALVSIAAGVVGAYVVSCGSGDASPGTDGMGGAGGGAEAGPDGATADGTAGSGGSGGTAGGTAGSGGAPPACENALPEATEIPVGTTSELAIAGDPGAAMGLFDPSIHYPAGATLGALTYSAVPAQNSVFTRIATSSDGGATWTYAADVNAPRDVTVTTTGAGTACLGGCPGRLIHEVSSVIEDDVDTDASRRWKVFTHSYVVLADGELRRDLGYIGLFTAPAPAGPWADGGKVIGWTGESDFSSQNAATVATKFAALSGCAALTEPSALFVPGGVVELALGCARVVATEVVIDVVLMRSVDDSRTFSYVLTPLSGGDARCFGGTLPHFNAPHLFAAGGRRYLLASPAGTPGVTPPDGYAGCHVFEMFASGALVRDAVGLPESRRLLAPSDARHFGACTYAEGAATTGYVVSALHLDGAPRVFRMHATGITAP